MYSSLTQISLALAFANHAHAWGDMGHRAIGYLSLNYMTPQAVNLFNDVIKPSKKFDISDAAVWADTVKGRFPYTYNWHFIDARDNPPSTCNVQYTRDCDFRGACAKNKDPGCVVGAIVNQTNQLMNSDDESVRNQALKYILHFVGDLHQPLHVEDLAVGGNQICVKWKGSSSNSIEYYESHTHDDHSDRFISPNRTPILDFFAPPQCEWKKCRNLHQVWDSTMIEELLDWDPPSREEDPKQFQEKARALEWANELRTDPVGNPELSPDDCVPVGPGSQDCALRWAGESNDLICSTVLEGGLSSVENKEISGPYYKRAVPVIKTQITKSARRFAAMLNAVAVMMEREGEQKLVLQDL